MKYYLEDIAYCLKLSLIFSAIPFVLGIIVGLILQKSDYIQVILWGCRMVQYLAALGLVLTGISFTKVELLRPLDYQSQWETYFKKFNLAFVILLISLFSATYSYLLEMVVKG